MCLTWMLESEPCFSFTTTHKNNRETNLPFFSRNLVSHFFWSCYKDSLQTNYRPTLRNSMECPSRRWSWVAQFPSADQVCLNQMHVSFHAENLFGKDPRECAWNVLSRGHIGLLCHSGVLGGQSNWRLIEEYIDLGRAARCWMRWCLHHYGPKQKCILWHVSGRLHKSQGRTTCWSKKMQISHRLPFLQNLLNVLLQRALFAWKFTAAGLCKPSSFLSPRKSQA
jgi:hypothetical protein